MRRMLIVGTVTVWVLVAYQVLGIVNTPDVSLQAAQVPIAAPVVTYAAPVVTTTTTVPAPSTTATTIAAPDLSGLGLRLLSLPNDADGHECFEDEVVVVFAQGWTGTHHEAGAATGQLFCAPWDNMRPASP